MTEKMSPVLTRDIPDQTFYAGLAINDLNLNDFIANPNGDLDGHLQFYVTLADGQALPQGISCDVNGVFTGKPGFDVVSGEAYPILVVAKNDADIPLVVYFKLSILEADAAVLKSRNLSVETVGLMADDADQDIETLDMSDDVAVDEDADLGQEKDYSFVDQEFEDFLESLNAEDVVNDPDVLEHAFGDQLQFSNELNDPEYLAFVIRYFIRKFSSLQIYNAAEVFDDLTIVNIYDATTGWKVYDSHVALTTTNPKPFSSDFSRSEFIATIREMISVAAGRGWQTIGVKGCDRELGYRLISEFNQVVEPEQRLHVDNYTEFSSWVERAESERFTKNYESRR